MKTIINKIVRITRGNKLELKVFLELENDKNEKLDLVMVRDGEIVDELLEDPDKMKLEILKESKEGFDRLDKHPEIAKNIKYEEEEIELTDKKAKKIIPTSKEIKDYMSKE